MMPQVPLAATPLGLSNRPTGYSMEDKFNVKGHCPSCGKLIGTLKVPPGNGMYRTIDTVVYHMAPTMIETRIKCQPSSRY